jgi:hypothetical protein
MPSKSMDVAFSPSVKAQQEARGSRAAYARQAQRGGWPTAISAELADFIASRRSFYLATASADGQPYIQHRGGAPGFLRVVDEHALAFDDVPGNRQFITLGNLAENPRVCLFLMDYEEQRRVKIWGTAKVVEDERARTIAIAVTAWSENCSQHIPRMAFI